VTGTDALLTTAEIAVAFAGFASVVTVFRRRDDRSLSPPDIVRFQLMISASLSVVLFALLPFAFLFFGSAEPRIWSTSSAILALYLGTSLVIITRRTLSLASAKALSPLVTWPFLVAAIGVFVLQVLNAAGVVFQRELGPYFLGLLYLLVLSGFSFARLLPIGRRSSAE
jgi:hypothetical protein